MMRKEVTSIVLNNFKNDSRVLKENISLQGAGYDVKVVALHEEGLPEFEEVQGIPVHRVRLRSKNWPKNKLIQLLKYFEFIYTVVKRYHDSEIIHCNDLNALPVGYFIKKFYNKDVKIVYDAHEYEINDKPNESPLSIKIKYFLEKHLITSADKVITVSDAIAEAYTRLYDIEKPALVLNTPLYQHIEKKDIFREVFQIKREQTIFLYQGGLSKGRGIETLLDAFKRIEDDRSVIVFMGYGPLEEMIKSASKMHHNIYFHPAVTQEVLLDHTSSADFGILFYENSCLNHYYCSPNKMFEYLMAELPVIVSNLYEMRRLVESNHLGVVAEENSVNGLLIAIQEASTLDKAHLQKSIQKIKERYNWQEQEKVLLDLYKELR